MCFQKLLKLPSSLRDSRNFSHKTRVILILNFTLPHAITYTNKLIWVKFPPWRDDEAAISTVSPSSRPVHKLPLGDWSVAQIFTGNFSKGAYIFKTLPKKCSFYKNLRKSCSSYTKDKECEQVVLFPTNYFQRHQTCTRMHVVNNTCLCMYSTSTSALITEVHASVLTSGLTKNVPSPSHSYYLDDHVTKQREDSVITLSLFPALSSPISQHKGGLNCFL